MDVKTIVDPILEKYENRKGIVIPMLQEVQKEFGYLPKEAIRYIAKNGNFRAAHLFGVATFYSMFRLRPQGRHIIRICKGTACHVSDADSIVKAINSELKLSGDEDTTKDGKFTVLEVACLGCCSLAPVIMVNDETHGKLSADDIPKILKKYD